MVYQQPIETSTFIKKAIECIWCYMEISLCLLVFSGLESCVLIVHTGPVIYEMGTSQVLGAWGTK